MDFPFLFFFTFCPVCFTNKTRRSDTTEKAVKYFEKSVDADNFCWSSIDSLCFLRKKPKTARIGEEDFAIEIVTALERSEKENIRTNENDFSEILFKDKQLQLQKQEIMNEIVKMAESLFLIRTFNIQKAFTSLSFLPDKLTWVKRNLALLFSEAGRYDLSEQKFREIEKLAPYSIKDVDIFSTTLWQLGKKAELSFMTQNLSKIFEGIPQFWVVMGNNFSLQKEHKKAIYCFQKAIEIDKNYTYGYSLLACENLTINEMDQAEQNYRLCLKLEPFNYKAWNGLGKVAMARSDFDLAATYYRKALSLNSGNHILVSHLAMAESKRGNNKEALKLLDFISGKNFLTDFQRAKILFEMGELDKAENILQKLTALDKDEAPILALLGEICMRKHMDAKALKIFNAAISSGDKEVRDRLESEVDLLVERSSNELLF